MTNHAELQFAPAYGNRQLFSNHFLETRLRRDRQWDECAGAARALRERVREVYRREGDTLTAANEAQTEEHLLRPVLQALGWGYEVQPRSQRLGATQFPDYALFATDEDARRAAAGRERRSVLKQALAVLEAKRWDRPLDARGGPGDLEPNRVPSTQIVNYLFRAEQPWGILTNGREWRLYNRDVDFADTAYFSLDLAALLGDEPLALTEEGATIRAEEAFRYFYLFFAPPSFRPDQHGLRWVDNARADSLSYARAVEAELKPRAYRAVTALCAGFAASAGVDAALLRRDETLGRTILDNSLTLLFRLLFVLFAEARDLLPVRTNPTYRSKSLLQLRERAKRVRDEEQTCFPHGRDFWNDLADLFQIIDGHPDWRLDGLPVYDGGLFDPDRHPWLENHYVPDPQLAEAIDLLSRASDPDTRSLHYVDYGPLDVRHLGSVYEGLLEYVLRVADATLPEIREKGRVIRTAVPEGDVYLANDKGERKVTGSYYTPDYVVQYIVERTLAPLVERRRAGEILSVRVLDPAMGSGHFLVAATAYLVRAAVAAVDADDQGSLGELAHLDPEHVGRLVVERCIFGVDRNPRAVELAKLSLWLATVEKNKPLNFLDHHLKVGDSLLGGRIERMSRPPARGKAARLEAAGQYNAFGDALALALRQAVGMTRQIEATATDSLRDVALKKKLLAEADRLLDRARFVGDVWCATFFGLSIDEDRYAALLGALKSDRQQWGEASAIVDAEALARLRAKHVFFHWEVEFGEAFHDAETGHRLERPGFDAVMGNPPYVRMEEFKGIKDFLRQEYETYATRSDLYVYFIERSLELLRDGGEYGAIVSNKFLRANYGKKLRGLIGRIGRVREIVDFAGSGVFPEATVRPALVFVRKGGAAVPARFAELGEFDDLRIAVEKAAFELNPGTLAGEEWQLVDRRTAEILARLPALGEPLGKMLPSGICWGIKTGLNEAFWIDRATRERLIAEDARSAEVIKPLVIGDDVRHYHIRSADRWLLYLPHGVDIRRYPAVEAHLAPFRERLERRATEQAWYELQQPQKAFRNIYERPKIVYPIITREPRFGLDKGGRFVNDKCFVLATDDGSVLALLNSRLCFFYLRNAAARLEGPAGSDAYIELRAQYMERVPIRQVAERTPERTRQELGRWLEGLYYRGLRKAGIEPEVPEEIRELGARIGALKGVEEVRLIGSWGRGHPRPDSDLDLLVVVQPDGGKAAWRERIRERLAGAPRPVDLHVYTPAEIERWRAVPGSFVGHVLEEGVRLDDGS